MGETSHRGRTAIALALSAGAGLGACLAGARAAHAGDDGAEPASVWRTTRDGEPYRVAFDPGHRLLVGSGAAVARGEAGTAATLAVEGGLFLRTELVPPAVEVMWKREHEILHLALGSAGAGGVSLASGAAGVRASGVVYRGLFLRHAPQGALTVPTIPPRSIPLPFDVGVRAEVGRMVDFRWPLDAGDAARVGVVRGEALVDFLRSRRPGRFVTVGFGGGYDLGLGRADVATALEDSTHLITPMTALSLGVRGESRRGLLAGGVRVDGQHRWSSRRGWEQTAAAEADGEWTPIAINDLPVSLFATGRIEGGGGFAAPELRALAGIRIGIPLRD